MTDAVSLGASLHLRHRVRSLARLSRLVPRLDRVTLGIESTRPARQARISLMSRVGHDRVVALVAASILLGASVVSVSASRPAPATGDTSPPGQDVRIAVGGGDVEHGGTVAEVDPAANVLSLSEAGTIEDSDPTDVQSAFGPDGRLAADPAAAASVTTADSTEPTAVEGPFHEDGTLLKPVAVNTTVADGRDLMETYKVKAGDTLTGIAAKYGVSMMTLWWANNLKSKDDLHLGQTLTIPPVTGLVLTVQPSDTLAGLAAKYKVDEGEILKANKLEDPNLVVGQVLAIPGAIGKAIPVPKAPATKSTPGSRGGTSRAPATYRGGAFSWPVSGGGNYISQYFHYGHYGLDIAADYGSPVRAAASGTVIFAGWKGNGGGYQVWIAHGSGLYTTYNHMSAISVGSGQSVSEGQQVGRVGQSGHATGPHLHFEVWRGGVWSGGSRVNPLAYL
jgi:murein DD-endopeptidase MepM/ murein hydrolase activator NlpD